MSYLHCKVFQAGIKQGVEVLSDGLLDKVGVDAPGHHPHTDEGRQQGAGLELGSVRERVEADQAHQVTQGLRKCAWVNILYVAIILGGMENKLFWPNSGMKRAALTLNIEKNPKIFDNFDILSFLLEYAQNCHQNVLYFSIYLWQGE